MQARELELSEVIPIVSSGDFQPLDMLLLSLHSCGGILLAFDNLE